ncbi:MAG: glycosyltransferase family 4 protein [Gammaproteobacteria bacterium]
MNILELCLSPGLGGLELYVFRSAAALSTNNNVIAVVNQSGKLHDYFKQHSVVETKYLGKSFKLLPLINAKKLAAIIDSENIDAVHIHWGNDLSLSVMAKVISRRKPVLIYTRQMKITRYKNDFYHRFLYKQLDLMLTITNTLRNEARNFISALGDRITTLYYGVDKPDVLLSHEQITAQRKTTGFTEIDFVVGLFGRLEKGKGQHLLIEAISMAKKQNYNPKALIVGHEMKPGYRQKLVHLAKEMGVNDDVVFMDFVPRPQEIMQLCDCVALTSQEETFGLVLPESMRCGVAVIGSNKGGVPEIITHEQTGLLFESMNAASLCEQIIRLMADTDLRQRIAINGKNEADERFNTEHHFKALENIIRETSAR